MKLELPDELSSRQDLKALVLEIRGYARWLNQSIVRKRVSGVQDQAAPFLSSATVELIKKSHSQQAISPKSLDELLAALEDYAATAPSITITLAAPPTRELKKSLIFWCRKNIKPNILVDFKFNSTMLGGMVVTYGSYTFDWSFKRQVLASKAKFPEILKHV